MRWRRRRSSGTGSGEVGSGEVGSGEVGSGEVGRPPEPARVVPAEPLVFVHLTKCGGTSISEWLNHVLDPRALSPERHRLPTDLDPERARALRQYSAFAGHFDVFDVERLPSPRVVFTVLRDPVDRIVSLYDFWRAHSADYVEAHQLVEPALARSMSFDDFVTAPDARVLYELDNGMVRVFCGQARTFERLRDPAGALETAVSYVQALDHVGHTSDLASTFAWLAATLHVERPIEVEPRNVRGAWSAPFMENVERTRPSATALAALEPLVRLDRELVARCRPSDTA